MCECVKRALTAGRCHAMLMSEMRTRPLSSWSRCGAQVRRTTAGLGLRSTRTVRVDTGSGVRLFCSSGVQSMGQRGRWFLAECCSSCSFLPPGFFSSSGGNWLLMTEELLNSVPVHTREIFAVTPREVGC